MFFIRSCPSSAQGEENPSHHRVSIMARAIKTRELLYVVNEFDNRLALGTE
jgi:hypothetical protein